MDENVPPDPDPAPDPDVPPAAEAPADDPVPSVDSPADVPPGEVPPAAAVADTATAAADESRRVGRLRLIAGVGAIVVAAAVGVGLGTAMSDDDEDPPATPPAAAEADFPELPGDGQGQVTRSNVLSGTVADVGDSTLTIDTESGDTEVAVDDDTTVTDTTEIDVSDLAVGDTVRVIGAPSDEAESIAAEQITTSEDEDLLAKRGLAPGFGGRVGDEDMPDRPDAEDMPELPNGESPDMEVPREGFDFSPVTAGTIESIDGDTITVTTEDGDTATVTTSSSTTVDRISEISLDELEAGDEVIVFASDDDGTSTATAIRRGEDLFAGVERPWPGSDDDSDA